MKEIKVKNTPLYLKMIYQYLYSFFGARKARFLSNEDTVERILKEKKSLIRFGDGEFDILEGKSIHYQEYSEQLRNELDSIIRYYGQNYKECPYMVAMPGLFLKKNGLFMLKSRLFMSCWSHTRYTFCKNYDFDVPYAPTALFAKGNEEIYEKIWQQLSNKRVVFVHNNETYAKHFSNHYGIATDFVSIPPENAYYKKEQILDNILSYCDGQENPIVLLSAGPAGKTLAFDLAKRGIWAIDTGHCWDDPLHDERDMENVNRV